MKFESSPTPPVIDCVRLTRFFTKQTATPLRGPIVKAASKAGSSEKSSEIKLGINGSLKLMNISTEAAAAKTAVIAILRVFARALCTVFVAIKIRTLSVKITETRGESKKRPAWKTRGTPKIF